MSALELVSKKYLGTSIESTDTESIKVINNNLDCNCVDSDCSTGSYED